MESICVGSGIALVKNGTGHFTFNKANTRNLGWGLK